MLGWIKYFTATLVIEFAAILILRLTLIRLNLNLIKAFLVGNLITHPVLYYFSLTMSSMELMFAELAVVVVEFVIFIYIGKMKRSEALGVAFFINGVSWGSKIFVIPFLH